MSKYTKFYKKSNPEGQLSIGGPNITFDILSKGQKEAFNRIVAWYKTPMKRRQPIYRFGAGSGFGKGWLIKYLIDFFQWDRSECYVMSYTGQSVNVLRGYGVYSNTIHSTIMIPVDEPLFDKDGKPIVRSGVPVTAVKFKPVKRLPSQVKLLIIDEASFLPESIEKILLRYNVPILEIGDPIQLPPVTGRQVFRMDTLDFFGEGVMRQNENNEIYKLGTLLKNGEHINPADFSREVRFLKQQETIEDTFMQFLPIFRAVDMIVVCTNRQRQVINDLYREIVLKANSPYPMKGERMICRRNNRAMVLSDFMLSNGMQGECLHKVGRSMVDPTSDTFMMDFHPDVISNEDIYFDDLICDCAYLKKPFGSGELSTDRHAGNKFEFAHALTAHIVQGATCDKIVYMDSFTRDRDYLNRIRYTSITRARKKAYFMIPYRGEWSL